MKLATIVGARPQFIKAAVLSRLSRSPEYREQFEEILVHTGQHYDGNMSEVFFREMGIPEPDVNLNIGSASHGRMTGEMLIRLEEVLVDRKPDLVLVYGDTNSTLAGALAASTLNIPVAHVEAGLRSFWKTMPEEQNRIVADHLSEWLFCPSETARRNLVREGITEGVHVVGDIMLDASLHYRKIVEGDLAQGRTRVPRLFGPGAESEPPEDFCLLTIHRAENTDDPARLRSLVIGLAGAARPIVFPVHPRTRKKLAEYGISLPPQIRSIDPVSYLEMLELELRSSVIVTDSGGVQKEAYFLRKPCVTLREQTEWTETVESGWNRLVGADAEAIATAVSTASAPASHPACYGDGRSGEKILELLSGQDLRRS